MPDFNTAFLQVADLAGKTGQIRGAWHHAGDGPGVSVRVMGWA